MFYIYDKILNHICKNIIHINMRECYCDEKCLLCEYIHKILDNICEYYGHDMSKLYR